MICASSRTITVEGSQPRRPKVLARSITSSPPGSIIWQDEFTQLADRVDAPPLPLPSISASKRVVLVRHGQSTWNAEGRIQGSSNAAVLTQKGKSQALTTARYLRGCHFDALIHSPLARAAETARIVWGDRDGPVTELPTLREIDLYAFQGLLKKEGKQRFGAQYSEWQSSPASFEVSGRAPVRELWYRASMAWQHILASPAVSPLVVAHNAVNQALIGTAIGLPPEAFRLLLQSNGATTAICFAPAADGGAPAEAVVDHINQVGDLAQLDESEAPKAGHARVYLVPLRADAAAAAQHSEVTTAEAVLQVAGLLRDGAAIKQRCSLSAVTAASMSDEVAAAGWQVILGAVGSAADGDAIVVECAAASDAARLLAVATKCRPDAFAPSPGGITLLTVSVEHRTLQQVACFNHCGHL